MDDRVGKIGFSACLRACELFKIQLVKMARRLLVTGIKIGGKNYTRGRR